MALDILHISGPTRISIVLYTDNWQSSHASSTYHFEQVLPRSSKLASNWAGSRSGQSCPQLSSGSSRHLPSYAVSHPSFHLNSTLTDRRRHHGTFVDHLTLSPVCFHSLEPMQIRCKVEVQFQRFRIVIVLCEVKVATCCNVHLVAECRPFWLNALPTRALSA